MKRFIWLFISLAVVIMLLLSSLSCTQPATTPTPSATPEPAKPIVLKFACPEPPEMADVVQIIQPWLSEMEERSGGRIKIEPHWSETLVPLPDSYQAVLDGIADIANFFPGMVPGQFTMDEVEFLPPMDYITWRPSRIYWELYQTFPEMQAQYSNVKNLWHSTEIGAFLSTAKVPVHTLEDLKGMKVTSTGQVMGSRAEALGMVPVPLPPTEIYSGLEKGTITAHPVPLKVLFAMKWGEVLDYLYLLRFTGMNQGFIMNADKFNSLPADIQKMIDDLDSEMPDLCDEQRWIIHNDALSRVGSEFGMEIITITPDEVARWIKASQPALDAYVATLEDRGLPGQKLVDEYYRLDKKYASDEYAFK